MNKKDFLLKMRSNLQFMIKETKIDIDWFLSGRLNESVKDELTYLKSCLNNQKDYDGNPIFSQHELDYWETDLRKRILDEEKMLGMLESGELVALTQERLQKDQKDLQTVEEAILKLESSSSKIEGI